MHQAICQSTHNSSNNNNNITSTSTTSKSQVPSLENQWSGPQGYGARHLHDRAFFTLWDDMKQDFRLPTKQEIDWLCKQYNATEIEFCFPIIFIATRTPPSPLPLTVAGVAAKFVPPKVSDASDNADARIQPLGDVRHLAFSTDYAGMRGPKDPLNFSFRKWFYPTDDQLDALMEALLQFCNPRFVHILCPRILVEIRCDGKKYVKGSMPRTIGGFSVHYHHRSEPLFHGFGARTRVISPDPTQAPLIHDTTNYLNRGGLGPGVCVCSAIFTNADGKDVSTTSTAGILLQDNSGTQRFTVAHHAFLHGDYVYHSSRAETPIGRINERWESLDIALVDLNPSVHFTNDNHFGTKRPRRLLRSPEMKEGSWFAVDGMSTGVVHMENIGLSLQVAPRPDNPPPKISWSKWLIYIGNIGAQPVEGLCGGAIIDEGSGTDAGGVAGFFQFGNSEWALAPCLNDLIDRTWRVV